MNSETLPHGTITNPTPVIDEDTESVLNPEIEAELQRAFDRRKLEFYEPYDKQQEFHRLSGAPGAREILLMAGNQLGKCAIFQSVIEHPDGSTSTFGERYRAGIPFDVWAWNGTKCIVARAVTPIKKPVEPCVRLWFADGRWFGCARNHRIMTETGAYVFCDTLLASLPILRVSTSESSQLVPDEGARHWSRRRRDFLVGCLDGIRLCDEQLLRVSGNARAWLRQRADVREHSYVWSVQGACSSKYTNSHQPGFGHPSNQDAMLRLAAQCVESVDRGVSTFVRHTRRCIQAIQRTLLEYIVPLRSDAEDAEDRASQEASRTPFGIDGNRIVAYETIPCQEVYDFTVPETSNYIACGIVHHNTMSAGAQTAIWTTGQYPKWWTGRRYDRPTKFWVGSPTGQTMREGPQRILLGEIGDWGTGMIPGRNIVDIRKAIHGSSDQVESVIVRHDKTKKLSRLLLKTYDQGRIRWQGATIDGVWFDEEPPQDIYDEGRTRTIVLNGFVYLTFTPLLGMTEVVGRYLVEKPPGSYVVKMGIVDAKHFTPERRAEIIAGYPAHEREARANGEPIMGSGRVFPIEPAEITESPIQIPDYWPRLAGLDIGWEHPTAVVWLAWDRDVDVVHVYDTYRMKEQTPLVHAAIIKKRGPWIPMAWPHDGHQHDKGSGKQIAQQYRNEGVLMLPTHATHPPAKDSKGRMQKEGEGGYSLEAGVSDMLIRMQTGRWKVSSLCQDWFDEYRMYYRKDGQIVKKGDDLMSASRVANMMLRFAKVRVVRETAPTLPGFQQTDAGMGNLG